jgi:hypothetical protein
LRIAIEQIDFVSLSTDLQTILEGFPALVDKIPVALSKEAEIARAGANESDSDRVLGVGCPYSAARDQRRRPGNGCCNETTP